MRASVSTGGISTDISILSGRWWFRVVKVSGALPEPTRTATISLAREQVVQDRLIWAREFIWQHKGIPDTLLSIVLPDHAISHIIKHLPQIVTIPKLQRRIEEAGMKISSSLLTLW